MLQPYPKRLWMLKLRQVAHLLPTAEHLQHQGQNAQLGFMKEDVNHNSRERIGQGWRYWSAASCCLPGKHANVEADGVI